MNVLQGSERLRSGRPSAYIVIQGPGHSGTIVHLPEGITSLGRLPSNDVVLIDELVSRRHSRIMFFGGRATFQDLDSQNGSFVNNNSVKDRSLHDGDIARVGHFELTFRLGEPPEATAATPDPEHLMAKLEMRASRETLPPMERPTAGSGRPGRESGEHPSASVVRRLGRAIAQGNSAQACAQAFVHMIQRELRAEVVAYFEHSNPGRALASVGPRGTEPAPAIAHSVVQWALAKNFPVLSDNVREDLRFSEPDLSDAPSALAVPVGDPSGTQPRGVLYLARCHRPFRESHADLASAFALLLWVGLERWK